MAAYSTCSMQLGASLLPHRLKDSLVSSSTPHKDRASQWDAVLECGETLTRNTELPRPEANATSPPTHTANDSHHHRFQRALILRAPRQPYEVVVDWPLPQIERDNEVLIKVCAAGLNPIDWKSPDHGVGIPILPAVTGRDLSGIVIATGSAVSPSAFPIGSRVFGPSTQYRDYRTSAFQEYAILPEHCIAKVPDCISIEQAAAIGVGAVASILTLGSALGVPLDGFAPRGLAIGAEGEEESWEVERMLLTDLVSDNVDHSTLPHFGKWILIWGGSSVSGFFIAQLAKMAGMRVIAVADTDKHTNRLQAVGIQHIVDRRDPTTAIQRIRSLTANKLSYAVDCVGPDTAQFVIQCLDPQSTQTRLVGLCGLPSVTPRNVERLILPVKTFHTNPAVGRGTMQLITRLLDQGRLKLPDVEVIEGGLASINGALDRLRTGRLEFGRLVVRVDR